MKNDDKLNLETTAKLKSKPIDFSDIPQFTPEQLAQFKPVNRFLSVKPVTDEAQKN